MKLPEERHQRFVQRVVASGIVWGLKDSEGWVTSSSTDDETEDRPIMPFWSYRAYAKQCANDEWSVYEPTEIPLNCSSSTGCRAWRGMDISSAPTGTRS